VNVASRKTLLVVVLALAVGLAVIGFSIGRAHFADSSVPKQIRTYVDGGGVRYAPAGQGYSVRLPSKPVRRDGVSTKLTRSLAVRRSIVAGDGFEIVVREIELPSAGALTNGLAGAVYDPTVGGDEAAIHVHAVTFAGGPAYDFDAGLSGGPTIRSRMFLRASRLYVVSVQGDQGDGLFDALMKSFRVTE
jgi:hypothetical protein